jgi:hypothetical protein
VDLPGQGVSVRTRSSTRPNCCGRAANPPWVTGELDRGCPELAGECRRSAVGELPFRRGPDGDHDARWRRPQRLDVAPVARGRPDQVSEEHVGVGARPGDLLRRRFPVQCPGFLADAAERAWAALDGIVGRQSAPAGSAARSAARARPLDGVVPAGCRAARPPLARIHVKVTPAWPHVCAGTGPTMPPAWNAGQTPGLARPSPAFPL